MNAIRNQTLIVATMALLLLIESCRKDDPALLPSIGSFYPQTATAGEPVKITGSRFTNVTAVSFGSVAAQSFKIISDSVIFAVVGNAASGSVVVTLASGDGTMTGFTYYLPQTYTLSGSAKYGSLQAFPAPDSSNFISASFQETGTIQIRRINKYDSIRNYTDKSSQHISKYVDSADFVLLTGVADDNYQFSFGNGVPSYKFSASAAFSVFAKIVDTLVVIPNQTPTYGLMLKGSGVLKNGKLTIKYNTDYRGTSKNATLTSQ